MRFFTIVGAAFAFLAVAAGAFGAHSLKPVLSIDRLLVFETAVRYQMYHALAMVVLGQVGPPVRTTMLRMAGWAFFSGIILFSGSLYVVSLFGFRLAGAVTPLGGVAFLLGWVAWAVHVWSSRAIPVTENIRPPASR